MKFKHLKIFQILFFLTLYSTEAFSITTGRWYYPDLYRVVNDVCYTTEAETVRKFIEWNTDTNTSCNVPGVVPTGTWMSGANAPNEYNCGLERFNITRDTEVRSYTLSRCGKTRGYQLFYRTRVSYYTPINTRKSNEEKSCDQQATASNPVIISTGEKIEDVTDFSFSGVSKLSFKRSYRSTNLVLSTLAPSRLGVGWSHNYEKSITIHKDVTGDFYASVNRIGGKAFYISKRQGTTDWISPPDTKLKLIAFSTYYELKTNNNIIERFDLAGKLILITYVNNYQISLAYDTSNRLNTISDNVGKSMVLTYDFSNHLATISKNSGEKITYTYVGNKLDKVTNADNTFVKYVYDDANKPMLLSGIMDERGNRYASWTYDANGRVLTGEHGVGIEKVTFQYLADGSRKITNSLNNITTYNFIKNNDLLLPSKIIGPGCTTCGTSDTSFTYDPINGNLLSKTTKGTTTRYSNYVAANKPGSITESFGTAEARTTDYAYDRRYQVIQKLEPSVHAAATRIFNTYIYDNFGNTISINIRGLAPIATATPINRTFSMQYNGPLHQLTQIDGPRPNAEGFNDLTSIDYYPNTTQNGSNRARVRRVTRSGLILRDNIQYTASGKIASELRLKWFKS